MKTLILIMAFFAITSSSFAQPTLNSIRDYTTGTVIKSVKVPIVGISSGEKGPNAIWDFSSIGKAIDTLEKVIVLPTTTPYASQFPSATIVEKNNNGSMVFVNKHSKSEIVGIVTNQNLLIKYTKPYVFLQRPFTFNDSISSIPKRTYSGWGETYTGSGTTLTTADAWGTLILPNFTYSNVLRLRIEQHFYDTASGSGMVIEFKTVSYEWYNDQFKSPLFVIDSTYINSPFFTDVVREAFILLEESSPPLSDERNKVEPKVSFINGKIALGEGLQNSDKLILSIIDVSGKEIHKEEILKPFAGNHIELPSKLSGFYIIQLLIEFEERMYFRRMKVLL